MPVNPKATTRIALDLQNLCVAPQPTYAFTWITIGLPRAQVYQPHLCGHTDVNIDLKVKVEAAALSLEVEAKVEGNSVIEEEDFGRRGQCDQP